MKATNPRDDLYFDVNSLSRLL